MRKINTDLVLYAALIVFTVLGSAFVLTKGTEIERDAKFCKSIQEKGCIPYPTSKEDIAKARECQP